MAAPIAFLAERNTAAAAAVLSTSSAEATFAVEPGASRTLVFLHERAELDAFEAAPSKAAAMAAEPALSPAKRAV